MMNISSPGLPATRREFLAQNALGIGGFALAWLLNQEQAAAAPHIPRSGPAYDDSGRQVARYDKIHLFSLALGKEKFSEQRTIQPGREVRVLESPFGRVGLSVCYDLRFPELYRAMQDVDIIVVPAAVEHFGRLRAHFTRATAHFLKS
jgi:predicted amidohydrolase